MRILLKICATAFLVLAIIQATIWAVAGVSFRDFELAFSNLRKNPSSAEDFLVHARQTQTFIKRAVSLAPNNPQYRLYEGRFAKYMNQTGVKLNDLPDPTTCFVNAARMAPSWAWPYLELAQIYSHGERPEGLPPNLSGDKLFALAIKLAPTMAYIHEKWADHIYRQILAGKDNTKGALSKMCGEYGIALHLNRDYRGKLSYYKALWQNAFIRTTALTRQYHLLRRLTPDSPTEWAQVVLFMNQMPEGLWNADKIGLMNDMYDQKDDSWPKFHQAVRTLATFGFSHEGLDLIKFYLRKQPNDYRAWGLLFSLSATYPNTISLSEKKELISQAIRESDFGQNTWLILADSAFSIGDKGGYLNILKEFLTRGGPKDKAYSYLGNFLEKIGEWNLAEQAFTESVRLNPTEVEYLVRLGQNLSAQGRYIAAVNTLEKAMALDPDNRKVLNAIKVMGIY